MATPTQADLERLEQRREAIRKATENMLLECRSSGRSELNEGEAHRMAQARADLAALDQHIREVRGEVERAQIPEKYARLGLGSRRGPLNPASRFSPIGWTDEQLRSVYDRTRRGETATLETRDPGFSSADSLLPPQLFPILTFPVHEARLLDRLPGFALDAPSLEYVQVNAVTGSAAVVGEGQPKPEIVAPATKLVCTALKLACHGGISWENVVDYETFTQAVRTELMRQVIDLENAQLWGGDPAAGGLNSLTKTAGILTLVATGSTENYTDFAGAIAHLRTGPSLAVPDLILIHPNTWANIRTQKDQYGRFLTDPNPAEDQADTIFGIDVLESTAFAAGEAVLVDTTKVGRVAVREPLTVRLGYSGSDFTDNIVRTVVEERLNFAVERPTAIIHVTGLPTTAPTVAKAPAAAGRK